MINVDLPVFPKDFWGAQASTSVADRRRLRLSLRGQLYALLRAGARRFLRWRREWIGAVGVSSRARSMMFLHCAGDMTRKGRLDQYAMSFDLRSKRRTTPSLITIVRGFVRTMTVWVYLMGGRRNFSGEDAGDIIGTQYLHGVRARPSSLSPFSQTPVNTHSRHRHR